MFFTGEYDEDGNLTLREPEEEWRYIPGYKGRYMVSNYGNVYSVPRKMILPHPKNGALRVVTIRGGMMSPRYNENGYLMVPIRRPDRKTPGQRVHRLVAAAFLGPAPPGMEVCHKDGSRDNNDVWNLRYDTRSGNFSDKIGHGTQIRGEKCHFSKLKEDEVRNIKTLLQTHTSSEVSKLTGTRISRIIDIKTEKAWKHIKV